MCNISDSEKLGYKLWLKEYGKKLVRENVPGEIKKKIRGKHLSLEDMDMVLYVLANLIVLCREGGGNKVTITSEALNKFSKMSANFVQSSCETLKSYGLLSVVKKNQGGSEYTINFDLNGDTTEEVDTTEEGSTNEVHYTVMTSEDGVERLFCEAADGAESQPLEEDDYETTVERLLSVIKKQQIDIKTLKGVKEENTKLKCENAELKNDISVLKKENESHEQRPSANSASRIVEEAKKNSQEISEALSTYGF